VIDRSTRAYTEYGDRRNPSILFLHGIRLGRDIWSTHASVLATRYHVVACDLPGHGALDAIPFTQATVGALLDRTIETLCPSPPLIVGYSLGGFVAMQYASRRPERTSALVLAGCTLNFEGWKHWPYEAGARLAELMPSPWFDALIDLSLHLTLPRAWADAVSRIPFNRDVISRTNRVSRGVDFIRTISSYRKPVLFINGEYDFIFRLDERRYLQALPQARLRVIRGVDHSAPMRNAKEFTTCVGDFAQHVFAEATP
jgi:pimeloyl-ACP methyl ester carboxylesterase